MADSWDVIVVGGGPGGVSCAALLARWGLRTLLVEKNARCGGKMLRLSSRGFTYQWGCMALAPLADHGAKRVLGELGLGDEYRPIPSRTTATAYRGRSGKWRTMVSRSEEPRDPGKTFELLQLDAGERASALRVLGELATMPREKVDTLDDLTFAELLMDHEIPGPVYSHLAYMANAMGIAPVDAVAAGEQIRMIQHGATLAEQGVGYVEGGLGRLYEVMARAVEQEGGCVLTRTRVEGITVRDGQVTGVVTPEGELQAPIVVSNAGIHPTVLKLVGEQHFDRGYVNRVKDLLPGWGFTGQCYFLERPVLDVNMFSIFSDESWLSLDRYQRIRSGQAPPDVVVFGTVPSCFDPGLAPPGKQLVIAGTLCSPDPEATEIEMLWEKVDETLGQVWPGFGAAVEDTSRIGPAEISRLTRDAVLPRQGGEAEGMGRQAGQCGTRKPSPRAPLRGLFYVGCDAGRTTAIGSDEAVRSGIEVARMVLRYQRMRR